MKFLRQNPHLQTWQAARTELFIKQSAAVDEQCLKIVAVFYIRHHQHTSASCNVKLHQLSQICNRCRQLLKAVSADIQELKVLQITNILRKMIQLVICNRQIRKVFQDAHFLRDRVQTVSEKI